MFSRALVGSLKCKRHLSTNPPQRLNAEERAIALKKAPSWKLVEGRDAIFKQYSFNNFTDAFGFMTKVAIEAEKVRVSLLTSSSTRLTFDICTDEPPS
jgi:4a-hydroxytetrahydrobiopterin dehydratase